MKAFKIYLLSLSIGCVFSLFAFYIESKLIFFYTFLIFLGFSIILSKFYIDASRTTKKLGYGPLDLTPISEVQPGVYSRWKFKEDSKLDEKLKWQKEFNEITKQNKLYYILGGLIVIIGFLLMFTFFGLPPITPQ